ncbi:hypothetical protein ACUY4R_004609 [Kosakonia sp. BK9b]
MHARDGLHQRAIAVFQPFTVQGFQTTDIRGAILRQFYLLPLFDIARHTQRPHPLVANLAGCVAVNITHDRQHMVDIALHRSDKLQQSFGKISSDPFMG